MIVIVIVSVILVVVVVAIVIVVVIEKFVGDYDYDYDYDHDHDHESKRDALGLKAFDPHEAQHRTADSPPDCVNAPPPRIASNTLRGTQMKLTLCPRYAMLARGLAGTDNRPHNGWSRRLEGSWGGMRARG